MKKIKKVLISSLLIMLTISTVPNNITLATNIENSTTNQKLENGLTYEKALELALKNNVQIKLANADIERSQEVRDKASDNLSYIPVGTGSGEDDSAIRRAFTNLVKYDIDLQNNKKKLEIAEDSLAYTVLKNYNNVLLANQNLNLTTLELENLDLQQKLIKQKYQVGIASKYDLLNVENSLEETKSKLKTAEETLGSAYQVLNTLIGLDAKERPLLISEPVYTPDENRDIELHITRTLNSSVSIWLAEQSVRLAELNLELYTFNDPSNPDSYEAKQIDVDKAKYNVTDVKKDLEQAIRTLYYQMSNLEETQKQLQNQLDYSLERLRLAEIKYDIGRITKTELLNERINVEKVRKSLYENQANLQLSNLSYEKPWISNNNN